jgi:hypothetical protein
MLEVQIYDPKSRDSVLEGGVEAVDGELDEIFRELDDNSCLLVDDDIGEEVNSSRPLIEVSGEDFEAVSRELGASGVAIKAIEERDTDVELGTNKLPGLDDGEGTAGFTPEGIETGQKLHIWRPSSQYKSSTSLWKPAARRFEMQLTASPSSYLWWLKQAADRDTPGWVTKLIGMGSEISRWDCMVLQSQRGVNLLECD